MHEVKSFTMSIKIHKIVLENKFFKFHALAFLPLKNLNFRAVFSHGYTSHKGDCLNWAQRLADAGIPTIIFDLPGHYLGSFEEVHSFEEFKNHAHECFETAFNYLAQFAPVDGNTQIVLGGHSLGAYLSLKALNNPDFVAYKKLAICVGLGINQSTETHLFETAFYEKTLNIRRQLVSPCLDSDVVFPWIKEGKLNVSISGQKVHLICGKDDVVVGAGGANAMKIILEAQNNFVTLDEPSKLSHHEPSLAASSIYQFLKKEFQLSTLT